MVSRTGLKRKCLHFYKIVAKNLFDGILKDIIFCFLCLIILWSVFLFIVLYCSSVSFFSIFGNMFSIFSLIFIGCYNFWRSLFYFCSFALQKLICRIGTNTHTFNMVVLFFSCFLLQSSVDWFGKSVATFTQWPPPGRTIGLISCIIFLGFANVKFSLHFHWQITVYTLYTQQ
jgi:hypothetical protein